MRAAPASLTRSLSIPAACNLWHVGRRNYYAYCPGDYAPSRVRSSSCTSQRTRRKQKVMSRKYLVGGTPSAETSPSIRPTMVPGVYLYTSRCTSNLAPSSPSSSSPSTISRSPTQKSQVRTCILCKCSHPADLLGRIARRTRARGDGRRRSPGRRERDGERGGRCVEQREACGCRAA